MDVLQVLSDADTLIMNTAVELAQTHYNIVVAGTDSGIVALRIHHCKPEMYFFTRLTLMNATAKNIFCTQLDGSHTTSALWIHFMTLGPVLRK